MQAQNSELGFRLRGRGGVWAARDGGFGGGLVVLRSGWVDLGGLRCAEAAQHRQCNPACLSESAADRWIDKMSRPRKVGADKCGWDGHMGSRGGLGFGFRGLEPLCGELRQQQRNVRSNEV
jgi:hypothetical protein